MPLSKSSKRPRSVESGEEGEEGDYSGSPVGKRQCSLPLRISPTSSPRRVFKQKPKSTGLCTIPLTLTPVESSDEDIEEEEHLSSLSAFNLSAFNISQPSTASSFLSTRANASESDAMDTTEMPPPSVSSWRRPQMTRRRSNGISAMTQSMQMNFSTNADQPDANGGRIPTPIYGHFTSTDVNMDTSEASLNSFIHPSARFQLRHNHNVLSPMMSEDGESEADWWRRRRLPSPAESPVISQRMETDDLTGPGMMDALSFDNMQTHNSEMIDETNPSPPLSSTSSRGSKGHAMFERRSDTGSEAPRKGKLLQQPISGIPRPRFGPRRYPCLTGSNRHSCLADAQARPTSRRGRSGGKIEVAPGEAKKDFNGLAERWGAGRVSDLGDDEDEWAAKKGYAEYRERKAQLKRKGVTGNEPIKPLTLHNDEPHFRMQAPRLVA
ncbi:hypothetical protein EPUS_06031 [Endocarpon pusillum Z07020]|uniref:Uncharacterized protein n=1 Tax=Endocarpon pusillum (strain Z07020 / HMAS-L-300199) TaxID=1263415 RepID=U1G4Z7_ENDPU|nr:uncharacterized protein EPUS_06031 [Endocarpon pusillum Z07020]ERF72402.1 hypothetical protein EPUS_06031 [Endocarpon pusillum Z07020]